MYMYIYLYLRCAGVNEGNFVGLMRIFNQDTACIDGVSLLFDYTSRWHLGVTHFCPEVLMHTGLAPLWPDISPLYFIHKPLYSPSILSPFPPSPHPDCLTNMRAGLVGSAFTCTIGTSSPPYPHAICMSVCLILCLLCSCTIHSHLPSPLSLTENVTPTWRGLC